MARCRRPEDFHPGAIVRRCQNPRQFPECGLIALSAAGEVDVEVPVDVGAADVDVDADVDADVDVDVDAGAELIVSGSSKKHARTSRARLSRPAAAAAVGWLDTVKSAGYVVVAGGLVVVEVAGAVGAVASAPGGVIGTESVVE
jgi:hypothetical protein